MQRAKALFKFEGCLPTDLPMYEGEVVTIVNKLPGNLWWEGESEDGCIGTFPFNYVEELAPDPEFDEFIGKKGISSLSIIQFDIPGEASSSDLFLVHAICGDGEYIAKMCPSDFVQLLEELKKYFPRLKYPYFPDDLLVKDTYKQEITDFFTYLSIHLMTTPVVLRWFKSIPRTRIAPCPHWRVICHTTNLLSDDSSPKHDEEISVRCGETYTLCDIDERDYLFIENETQRGWCSLRYCEILWMDQSRDAEITQLRRIVPFSLPSLQCSDELRRHHITMQSLRIGDRFAPHPSNGDTVVLRIRLYIWNSIRGYMYEFYNTDEHPIYHVIGLRDCSMITELLDHKLVLMQQGEKMMMIMHSSTDTPKEIGSCLDGYSEFYLCYVIDLRLVQKKDRALSNPITILQNSTARVPIKPTKPESIRMRMREIQHNESEEKTIIDLYKLKEDLEDDTTEVSLEQLSIKPSKPPKPPKPIHNMETNDSINSPPPLPKRPQKYDLKQSVLFHDSGSSNSSIHSIQ